MLDKVIENNRVCIIGEVVSEFTFSHEVFGEGFYIANVSVNFNILKLNKFKCIILINGGR